MATTPIITTAANYIRDTTLPLINASGNYALTMANGTISKDFMPVGVKGFSAYPVLLIMTDGPNAHYPLTTNGEYTVGAAPQDITTGYTVRIIGYVNIAEPGAQEKTGLLTDEMDKLISDIIIAMHDDRTLGGAIDTLTLLGSDKSLEFWQQNVGVVEVWFALKYDFRPAGGTT